MYTKKSSITFKSHNGSWSQWIRPGKQILGKQIRPNFFRSTSLLYKMLPTNLGTCKPTLYTFYTSHLRWNGTMRRCFYHTDLRQNAVFHNFSRQAASIQCSGPSKHAWAFSETVQKISKNHLYGQPVLTFDKHQNILKWTLKELRFNIIKNLLCLLFI